jgi:hypothetical protein
LLQHGRLGHGPDFAAVGAAKRQRLAAPLED